MADSRRLDRTAGGAEALRDVIQAMLDSGIRHAELDITFGDSKVKLLVTLASVEYDDGVKVQLTEVKH